jgi:hypothetical protein
VAWGTPQPTRDHVRPGWRPGRARRVALSIDKWEQLGNNSAQTPGRTGEQGRRESRTNQQHRRPGPVCKTSIPGSNPGGASKIHRKSASFVHTQHNRAARFWTTVDYKSRCGFLGASRKRLRLERLAPREGGEGRRSRDPPPEQAITQTAPSLNSGYTESVSVSSRYTFQALSCRRDPRRSAV